MSKLFPHPVLGEQFIDYKNKATYSVEYSRDKKNSATIVSHKLTNNNFVAEKINEGTAFFFTTVSAKQAIYRHSCIVDKSTTRNNYITAEQVIKLPDLPKGKNLVYHPGIFCKEKLELTMDSDTKLDSFFFDGPVSKTIVFKPYSVLASDGWTIDINPALSELFIIQPNDKIVKRKISTSFNASSNNLQIQIDVNNDLFRELSCNDKIKDQILAIAFAHALQELRDMAKQAVINDENDTGLLGISQGLELWLDEKGHPDLREIDNEFNPSEIATSFRPILKIEND